MSWECMANFCFIKDMGLIYVVSCCLFNGFCNNSFIICLDIDTNDVRNKHIQLRITF